MKLGATPDSFDAIVIGAGHNGLICAGYLARAKKKVLVIERQREVGGAAVTAEISPQFSASVCAHLLYGFSPQIARDLKLKEQGLELSKRPIPFIALGEDGRHIILGENGLKAKDTIAAHSPADAEAYEEVNAMLLAIASAMRPLITAPPPPAGGPLDPASGAYKALDEADRLIAKLEPEARRLLTELVAGPLADMLERSFETPLLQGALAFKACLGNAFGPRSAGSGLQFLLRLALERDGKTLLTTYPKGGLGAFSRALAASAQKAGARIRTGTTVAGIVVENGRVAGVRLDDGSIVNAPIVISNADPKQTFMTLLPKGQLGTGFSRAIRRLRSTALTAKLNLALDGPPEIPGLDFDALGGRLIVAPSINHIEDALSEALAGRFSTEPVMEVTIPTIHDPELAPVGQHIMSIIAQYAPYETDGGWAEARDGLAERVLTTLGRYIPSIRDHVLAGDVMSPPDLEQNFGLPRGNWHHIEAAPDQLFWLRPAPGAEAHVSPVPGLYLCGVGSHPAGDITGLAGRNAAQAVLAAERKS